MSRQILEVENAKAFLDVVFGVVLGLPISDFPKLVSDLATAPSLQSLVRVLLLSSALAFCSFYWLEVRHFIEEQKNFSYAVKEITGNISEFTAFTDVRFIGSLVAIALAAATLKFAELNFFRPFVTANILFWMLDLLGNWEGKKIYEAHKDEFYAVQKRYPDEHRSYIGRFGTKRFWLDGFASILSFIALLALDYVLSGATSYRVIASACILILTLFRHLFWRRAMYDKWKSRNWQTHSSSNNKINTGGS